MNDLRDSVWGRVALLVGVLLFAFLAARACTGARDPATRAEAIEIARGALASGFEPDGMQVRYVNRGLPPRGTWIVSFYDGTIDEPTAIQTVLVDAATGEITDDGLPG